MSKRKGLALHWKILIGLVLGVVVGLVINLAWSDNTWSSLGVDDPASFIASGQAMQDSKAEGGPNEQAGAVAHAAVFVRNATEFVGDLFMNGLRFIAVPIVLFSLAAGIASLNDTAKVGRIGVKTITIYLATTAVAISVGLVAANIIGPGNGFPEDVREQLASEQRSSADSRIDSAAEQNARTTWSILLDIFPTNPFAAMAAGNTLQVVVVGLLVGISLTLIPREDASPVIRIFDGMTKITIKIVEIVLLIAPFAVFALIVTVIADLGVEVLQKLVAYCLTAVLGLALMMFVVYPTVLRALTPVKYGRFFRAISPAQLLAFSSSSSGATMPVTMECVEKRLGVEEDISSFVIPVGATINMDGTALYQGVAAAFIAQMYGLSLTLGDQLTIVLTATLASIGTAAVPGVGIVMLVIVLESVGIPLEGIAVILGVDRIIDMCRTSCNVTGDCMVAAVVASSESELLTEAEVEARTKNVPLDEQPPDEDTSDAPPQAKA
ncbi:MAG: dicarboxylate/amino acid:cation symporter [Planctomycetota bacterium]